MLLLIGDRIVDTERETDPEGDEVLPGVFVVSSEGGRYFAVRNLSGATVVVAEMGVSCRALALMHGALVFLDGVTTLSCYAREPKV